MERIETSRGGNKYFTVKNFIYLLLVLSSMIPGYVLVKYAIDFSDEPYQIMNSMDIYRGPMFPISSWLGGIFGRLTDFRWLSFRYLAVTLNNLAIITSGIYLFHRSKSIKITAVTVSVAILLSGLSRNYHNLYGWDCWTSFFLVLTLVSLLFLIERRGVLSLILLCVLSALTAMARIPNAVIIPIVWFILFISATKLTKINLPKYYSLLYLLICSTLIFVIILSIYGSTGSYIKALNDNIVNEHSLFGLIAQNAYDVVRYSFSVMALCMLSIILDSVRGKNNIVKPYRKIFVIIASVYASIVLLLMMLYFPDLVNEKIIDNYWIFLALFFAMWQFYRKKDIESVVLSVSIFLSGFVCSIGSNLGFYKYPAYIFIPLTTTLLLNLCSLNKIKYFALIAAVPLFVMEACVVIPHRSFKFGEGVLTSDTLIEEGRARGIYTTADKAKTVEEIIQFCDSIDPKYSLIVVSENCDRHVYHYLLDCPDAYQPHNFEGDILNSTGYIEWLQKRVDKAEYPVVVYAKRYVASSTKMKEYLDKNMKLVSDNEIFMVYMPESE